MSDNGFRAKMKDAALCNELINDLWKIFMKPFARMACGLGHGVAHNLGNDVEARLVWKEIQSKANVLTHCV